MIEFGHVTRRYGEKTAVDDLSLAIPRGELFALLGPNGAGKSTLLRTIATLQRPDSGTIRLGDLDVLGQPDEVRKILGYLPQEFGLYPNLSAESVLDHFTTLKGVTARGERRDLVASLLEKTNLWDAKDQAVGGFSGGMKQRLGIAIALAGDPKLLIVDEPTAGLDPTERHRFLNLIADLGRDIVVILSTHIVEDVRELCSTMAIIHRGRVVLEGDPSSVLEEARGKVWRKRVGREELERYEEELSVISVRLQAGGGGPGSGAFENDRPIAVSVTPALEDAILATGFAYDRNRLEDTNFDNLVALGMKARGLRRMGAAALDLAYVASGRLDGFWELHLHAWDVAAGAALIRAAGGRVTDQRGGEDWLFGGHLVASNGMLHEALRAALTPLKAL